MHFAITIQYPSPSSTFLQTSTIDKSCQLPQISPNHPAVLPAPTRASIHSSFLQTQKLHKPAAHLSTYRTSSLTMGCSLLSAFHPSPGSLLHPWWISFDHGSHCRSLTHTSKTKPSSSTPREPFLILQLDITLPEFPIIGTSISSSLAHHPWLAGLGHRGNGLMPSKNPKNMRCRKSSHH